MPSAPDGSSKPFESSVLSEFKRIRKLWIVDAQTIHLNEKLMMLSKEVDFSELCITSGAKIEKIKDNNSEEIIVETFKADGKKCPVCWKISPEPCSRHFS